MLNIGTLSAVGFLLLAGILAFVQGLLTSTQMRDRGIKNGFPFIMHPAMWANLCIVPLAAGIMWNYATQWTPAAIGQWLLISSIISIGLHIVWSKMTDRQEHICSPGLNFTASGLVNAFHLTAVITIALLFYMNTQHVSVQDARMVTGLLMVYLPLGNAFVGKMKSGHFDAPGVIGTIALMGLLGFAHYRL